MAATRDASGPLVVFARGADHALYHAVQAGAAWCAWVPLGTQLTGTELRVEVTAPNMIGAGKTLTVRSRRDPSITTRCLEPGATRDSAC